MVLNSEEERLPLASSKKHVSVKERTKARFDKIIKTALKEPKIKSNKEEILLQSLERKEDNLELFPAQETSLSNFRKVSGNVNSEEQQGLVNPSYEKDASQEASKKSDEKNKKMRRKKPKFLAAEKSQILTKADIHQVPNNNENLDTFPQNQNVICQDSITSSARRRDSDEKIGEGTEKLATEKENVHSLIFSSGENGEKMEEYEKRKVSNLEGIARKSRREKLAKSQISTVCEKLAKTEISEEITSNGEEILAITIHRMDRLQLTTNINHPLVQVHVIDAKTGNYVKKLHRTRCVTSFYESRNDKVDFILPVMTAPFDFKQKRSVIPRWEETILYNESFRYLSQDNPDVIIFFEVLDFVTAEHDTMQSQTNGWFRIAWAFLKLVGRNGTINARRKMQLQLYHPPRHKVQAEPGKANIFLWWSNTTKLKYEGGLHVTVSPILNAPSLPPQLRSSLPTQQEQGRVSLQDFCNNPQNSTEKVLRPQQHEASTTWDRLAGQTCKIPNKNWLNLPGGTKGCLVCCFSPDGKKLACGCSDGKANYVSLFEIPSGKWIKCLEKHHGLIYDIGWASDCESLVSASADATCRFWKLEAQNASVVLPHPSFAYAAAVHPLISCLVVTGCYDRTIRLWKINKEDERAQLVQELDGHVGHINSLCFESQGLKLFSADSVGTIRIWNCHVTAHPRHQDVTQDWALCAEIRNKELQGIVINHIYLHPNGRNLAIHAQDSHVYLMDTVKHILFQRYKGILNSRERIRSCVSPCGSYMFSGSEEGTVVVHNVTTEEKTACYSNIFQDGIVHCSVYHPWDHIVAFCSLGEDEPIVLYKFDIKAPLLNVKQVRSLTAVAKPPRQDMGPLSSTPIKSANGHHLETLSYEPRRSVTFNLSQQTEPNSLLEKIKSRLAYVTDTSLTMQQSVSNIKDASEENLYDTVDTWRTWGSTFDTYESSTSNG